MSRNKCESDSDIAGATKKRSRTQEMAGESSLSEVALLAFEAQGPECRMVHEGCSSHLEFNPVLLHHLWWGKKELLPRYLEKAMAPHSSTLAWKIPWTEEPGRLQSMGSLRVRHDWATSLSLFTSHFHGNPWNGNPLQCSCLEHPGTGEPGGLLSMGSHTFGHDWSDAAAAATAAPRHYWVIFFKRGRESIPRQVDKKSRVSKEEIGVWNSLGG